MHIDTVKPESEMRFPFDLVREVATISPEDSFRPVAESQCALLK